MTYEDLCREGDFDLEKIVKLWESVSASDLPEKLPRGNKRRKGEGLASWRTRGVDVIRRYPPERPKADTEYAHYSRFPETLDSLREVFGLSDEDIRKYGKIVPPNNFLRSFETETERKQRETAVYDRHKLEKLRSLMWGWVADTYIAKKSEAACDLDCFFCESPKMLNCAAQNLSVADMDGHDLSIEVLSPGGKEDD